MIGQTKTKFIVDNSSVQMYSFTLYRRLKYFRMYAQLFTKVYDRFCVKKNENVTQEKAQEREREREKEREKWNKK